MGNLWFGSALLPDGFAESVRIEVADGRIASVAAGMPAAPHDERHAIGIPGLPNLHSHGFQRGMAGLAERRGPTADSFWTWREVMYRFLDRMDPDDVEAVTTQAFAEMLEAGFTRVGEFHYLHHASDGRPYAAVGELASRVAGAAAATGIALTLLPVFYAHGGIGGVSPVPGQRRFLSDPDLFAELVTASRQAIAGLDGAVLGIAPHSLRAATVAEIGAILPLADGGPVHIHAAEQVAEVEQCVAFSGRRPVEYLLDALPVDARWCLIHATHLTPVETARLAASGAVAGLCPITEASLGDGVFPGEAFAAAGGRFGVGTDSNVLIGAADELRQLEYAQRLVLRRRNILGSDALRSTGRALFGACLAGGAQALGVRAGLAVGCPADLVSLDAAHPALCERAGEALLDAWIFAARSSPVDCVWRGGVKVVADGRHLRRDAILARFRAAMQRLLAA
jgi:formimidoylglutamate deiminase